MNTVQNNVRCDEKNYLTETVPSSTNSLPHRFQNNGNGNGNGNHNDNERNVTDIQGGNDSTETENSAATGVSDTSHAKEIKCVIKKNKAISYQDIHSEYTKRRYRNVESKVAQYIANIRAQNKKHQNSRKSLSHGTLFQHQQHNNDQDGENNEDDQAMSPTIDDTAFKSHETSIDGVIYVEKHIYEQLIRSKESYDYLQAKLEEKHADNCRLKQNLDLIRIELSQCKDKLKQKSKNFNDYRSVNNLSSVGLLSKYATETFLYPAKKGHKTTQTEIILTPSPLPRQPPTPMPAQERPCSSGNKSEIPTPLTPDFQNPSIELNMLGKQAPIKVSKSSAAIQPLALNFSTMEREYAQYHDQSNINNNTLKFLRQRSNSLAKCYKFPHCVQVINSNSNDLYLQTDFIIVEPSSTPATKQQSQPETTITTSTITINPVNRNRSKCIRARIKKLLTLCIKCHEISDGSDSNNNSNNNLLDSAATNYNLNSSNDNRSNTTTQQQSYTQVPLL